MLRARYHHLHTASFKATPKHKVSGVYKDRRTNGYELEKASKRLCEIEQIIRITSDGASDLQPKYLFEKCCIIIKVLRNVFNMLSRSILQSVCKANRSKSAKHKTLYGSLPIFRDCLTHLDKMKARVDEFCIYAQSLITVMSDTITLVPTSVDN